MALILPPIKAYSKTDICYLLRDPECNLFNKTAKDGSPVTPMDLKCLKDNLKKHLAVLQIASEDEYDSIRIFRPTQVDSIFSLLL